MVEGVLKNIKTIYLYSVHLLKYFENVTQNAANILSIVFFVYNDILLSNSN